MAFGKTDAPLSPPIVPATPDLSAPPGPELTLTGDQVSMFEPGEETAEGGFQPGDEFTATVKFRVKPSLSDSPTPEEKTLSLEVVSVSDISDDEAAEGQMPDGKPAPSEDEDPNAEKLLGFKPKKRKFGGAPPMDLTGD
jgi:hypothetical protein